MKGRRRKPPIPRKKSGAPDPDMASLLELERFTDSSFKQWIAASKGLDALYSGLYFDLEPSRQRDGQDLLDAARRSAIQDFQFDGWSRIVDYQFSLTPLSTLGSVRGIGGRFNIGQQISPGTITSFPALYVAEDYETAFREKFGMPKDDNRSGLKAHEFALRTEASFTQVRVRGAIDFLLDVGDVTRLQLFTDIIKKYPLPKSAITLSRNLGMKSPPLMVRTAAGLQRQLLHKNWRSMPIQFSIPSNSQIFARVASAAGLHGILFPSVRNAQKRCLALFPQNWGGSASHIELLDKAPTQVAVSRIDGGTLVPH